jgi:hypothetical protein
MSFLFCSVYTTICGNSTHNGNLLSYSFRTFSKLQRSSTFCRFRPNRMTSSHQLKFSSLPTTTLLLHSVPFIKSTEMRYALGETQWVEEVRFVSLVSSQWCPCGSVHFGYGRRRMHGLIQVCIGRQSEERRTVSSSFSRRQRSS